MNPLEQWPLKEGSMTGFCAEPAPWITDYMSFSRISTIMDSVAHYKLRYIDGEKPEESPDMRFGKILHMAILQPGKFKDLYRVAPRKDEIQNLLDTADDLKAELKRRGLNASGKKEELVKLLLTADPQLKKRIWDCVIGDHNDSLTADNISLTPKEIDKILGISNAFLNHPKAPRYVNGAQREVAAYFEDKELGVVWRAHLDFLRIDHIEPAPGYPGGNVAIIGDLKKTRDASPWGFPGEIYKHRYHVQSWIYKRIVQGITGLPTANILLACEETKPYGIGLHEPTQRALEIANVSTHKALFALQEAQQTGVWLVYTPDVQKTDLPNWAYWREEERADAEVL